MNFYAIFLIILVLPEVPRAQQNIQEIFNENINAFRETTAFQNSYDFIIIGAGSGGSVVANRLTENPKWTVLLLEAGRDETFFTDIPLFSGFQSSTNYNWKFKNEKQNNVCLGHTDQQCAIPNGKAIGGSSVINFSVYSRGNKLDYDQWQNLGNYGWSYQNVLPYFKKSENCAVKEVDEEYRGKGGYLSVQDPPFATPLVKLFLKAGAELGYNITDPCGKNHIGFSRVQATIRHGRRCSASKAFLKPIKNRPNFFISSRSFVTKILIDPQTKKVYGVEFTKNFAKYRVKVKKEVILSGGSINSPRLLMHSGVGPREDLERAHVPVIQDLKVGYNLQDHFAMIHNIFLVNESVTLSIFNDQTRLGFYNYVVNGNGALTIAGGVEALAFLKTKYAENKDDGYPEVALALGAAAINVDFFGLAPRFWGISENIYQTVYGPIRNRPAFSIGVFLLRPKSTGRVTIKDNNSLHYPIIKSNYLEDERDLLLMVEAVKMSIRVGQTESFKKYKTTYHDIPIPGCEDHSFNSDPYLACVLRLLGGTAAHQVGTCKMGPATDPEAVVDPELRVYGIVGLRVVDGSIMPNIITGHPNSVIMMIGEKAADMIKNFWEKGHK